MAVVRVPVWAWWLAGQALPWISHVELATVVVFGIDYLLRVLTVHGVSQR